MSTPKYRTRYNPYLAVWGTPSSGYWDSASNSSYEMLNISPYVPRSSCSGGKAMLPLSIAPACVCVCARARVFVCVFVCVRAYVCVCARARLRMFVNAHSCWVAVYVHIPLYHHRDRWHCAGVSNPFGSHNKVKMLGCVYLPLAKVGDATLLQAYKHVEHVR